MSKAKPSHDFRRFSAPLTRLRSRLNWIVAYVPFDVGEVWGARGQIKVRGDMEGFAFRTSLFPAGEGRHFILINTKMQTGAKVAEGCVAKFVIGLDREERTVTLPAELVEVFLRLTKDAPREGRALRRWYEQLNYSTRAEIAKWISDPKSGAARERRAEQMAERMLSVMDAERELPPILQAAFARHPQAHAGWETMSEARRRGHLFGIFYYRTPEAQARRIEKMLDDASWLAEKARS